MQIAPARLADREDVLALLGAQMAEHAIDLPTSDLAAAIDGVLAEPARGVCSSRVRRAPPSASRTSPLPGRSSTEGGSAGSRSSTSCRRSAGTGSGRRLLGAVSARARAAGCRALDLEVDAGHARAAGLYTRHGFRGLPRARFTLRLGEP